MQLNRTYKTFPAQSCLIFSLLYPLLLAIGGYTLLKLQLNITVYANVFCVSCASILCSIWFYRKHKRFYILLEIFQMSLFIGLYDMFIQLFLIAYFFGAKSAFVENLGIVMLISIAHMVIAFFGLLIISSAVGSAGKTV